MKFKIAVIGGGPSGITALKNLFDQGIEAVAFDKNLDVGGNWIYSEDESHSSVFETTKTYHYGSFSSVYERLEKATLQNRLQKLSKEISREN